MQLRIYPGLSSGIQERFGCVWTRSRKPVREIRWDGEISPPGLDRTELLGALLRRARIDFDLKEKVARIWEKTEDPLAFLAELHSLEVPEALYGALLELLSAE